MNPLIFSQALAIGVLLAAWAEIRFERHAAKAWKSNADMAVANADRAIDLARKATELHGEIADKYIAMLRLRHSLPMIQ